MNIARRVVAVGAASLISQGALADEGGVSFWLPGQYGSFAALPPETGFSMPLVTYGYSGDASAEIPIQLGGEIGLGVDARYLGQFFVPTYSPETEIWGGQAAFSLAFILAKSDVSAEATLADLSRGASETVGGVSDIFPTAQVFWNNGVHNWMTYITGAIPVGDYEAGRLTNLGIGHAAIDVGGAYTYLDPETGWEASATIGATYNFENSDTDYRNGNSIHLDWAASRYLSEQLHMGLVGFAYKQVSDDEGAPPALDGFRSETYGIGPQIGYTFNSANGPIYANFRAYREFEVQHRTEGTAAYLTLSLPF